jgi:hypothetical protein
MRIGGDVVLAGSSDALRPASKGVLPLATGPVHHMALRPRQIKADAPPS